MEEGNYKDIYLLNFNAIDEVVRKFSILFKNPREFILFNNFIKNQAAVKNNFLKNLQNKNNDSNKILILSIKGFLEERNGNENFVFINYILFEFPELAIDIINNIEGVSSISSAITADFQDEKLEVLDSKNVKIKLKELYEKFPNYCPSNIMDSLIISSNSEDTIRDFLEIDIFLNKVRGSVEGDIEVIDIGNYIKDIFGDKIYFFMILKRKIILELKREPKLFPFFFLFYKDCPWGIDKEDGIKIEDILNFFVDLLAFDEFLESFCEHSHIDIEYEPSLTKDKECLWEGGFFWNNVKLKETLSVDKQKIIINKIFNMIINKIFSGHSCNYESLEKLAHRMIFYAGAIVKNFNIEDKNFENFYKTNFSLGRAKMFNDLTFFGEGTINFHSMSDYMYLFFKFKKIFFKKNVKKDGDKMIMKWSKRIGKEEELLSACYNILSNNKVGDSENVDYVSIETLQFLFFIFYFDKIINLKNKNKTVDHNSILKDFRNKIIERSGITYTEILESYGYHIFLDERMDREIINITKNKLELIEIDFDLIPSNNSKK